MANTESRITMKSRGFWGRGFLGLALAGGARLSCLRGAAGALSTGAAFGQSSASERSDRGTDARSDAAAFAAARSVTDFAEGFAAIAIQRCEEG